MDLDLKNINWTVESYELFLQNLILLQETKYQLFQKKLIPGIDKIIGIPIPKLRTIAKAIAKGNFIDFLNVCGKQYYEEDMLYGMVIGYAKINIETVFALLDTFIPRINNWAVCDCCCSSLKIFGNYKQETFTYLKKQIATKEEYAVRFGVISLMNFFVEEKYLSELFFIFDSIKVEKYYVKMGVAWAISVCFVKFQQETMAYLQNCQLDQETYQKSLQKILESRRVAPDVKEEIRQKKQKH